MKKYVCLFLVFAMVISITACNAENENVSSENSELSEENLTETTNYLDTLDKKDFEASDFLIYNCNIHSALMKSSPVEDGFTGEPVNDAMYQRDLTINELYNVNIKYHEETSLTPFRNSILSEDNHFDTVFATPMVQFSEIAREGLLYNIKDMPYISLESLWWTPQVHQNLTLNNTLYFMSGDIVPSIYLAPGAMFVNLSLKERLGIDTNIYDLVKNGKWTIDAMNSMSKGVDADLNGDGVIEPNNDRFGVVSYNPTLTTNTWYIGLGEKLCSVDQNNIYITYNHERSVNVIDKLKANSDSYFPFGGGIDIIGGTFFEGRALFLNHFLQTASVSLRDMEDDYGIIPLPKYDESQESYQCLMNTNWDCFVGYPNNLKNVEKSAFLSEAMAYLSYEYIRPEIYGVLLKAKITRDPESTEMIDIILDSAYVDFNCIYNFGGSTDIINKCIMNDVSIASEYAKFEKKIENDIKAYIDTVSGNQ